jgi:hypothetical protein
LIFLIKILLHELPKAQSQRIKESKEQIKQGDFLTNEQADKLVDKWLKE